MAQRTLPSRKSQINGAIVYQGPSQLDGAPIVAIATGLNRSSANAKTGDMIQVWILRADENPISAAQSSSDASICGTCPHRGTMATRTCYVQLPNAPRSVYAAFTRGIYPTLEPGQLAGRKVRLGAYGDPAAVPFEVWKSALAGVTHWTGYTHQWRNCDQRFRSLLMASCDVSFEVPKAQARGWRTFFARTAGDSIPTGSISCPASEEMGKRSSCDKCGLCNGARDNDRRKSITIAMHGATGSNVAKQAAMLERAMAHA